jgi:hypothetical protein
METVSIVVFITLTFAAVNLFAQLLAIEAVRRDQSPRIPEVKLAPEHPVHSRIDGMPRTRTDRHDLQLGMGHDFFAPDVEQAVWPRDPRI